MHRLRYLREGERDTRARAAGGRGRDRRAGGRAGRMGTGPLTQTLTGTGAAGPSADTRKRGARGPHLSRRSARRQASDAVAGTGWARHPSAGIGEASGAQAPAQRAGGQAGRPPAASQVGGQPAA